MEDQIIESWMINHRINLKLIDAISDEEMDCTLSSRGGGTPAKQFAHMHNIRLSHLQGKAKDLNISEKK